MARIDAALQRIAAAPAPAPHENAAPAPDQAAQAPPKVLALVNSHEKLREEVADTLRQLDDIITDLEK
ncbi:hypothetical protein MTsPCn3_03750 [Erythrobacter sp. MTPC3]